ncbi:E3 ubiquitin-protein ligase [Canna indica]|uniref:E3 ubiquitin-protein ligase n=1 Tax=Canna indica TaxID=4628 RepID=A0AAQ3KHR4_9LILI|nr:E3 ubiquitin-protein ligase [Canna indica]
MSTTNNQSMSGGGGDSVAPTASIELMVATIIFFFMVVILAFFFYLYAKQCLRSAFRARYCARFAFAGTVAELDPTTIPGGGGVRSLRLRAGRRRGCSPCAAMDSTSSTCIDLWFHSHSTCPLCRSPIGGGSTWVLPSETAEESPVISSSASSATAEVVAGASFSGGSTSRKPPGGMLAIEIPRRSYHVPTLFRALVGYDWYGIETWIDGEAVFLTLLDVELGQASGSLVVEEVGL